MAFVMPSDPCYQRAKRAKQGKLPLPEPFERLADGIEKRYGVRPLWIETDHIKSPASRPRLSVVIERTADYKGFARSWNFDPLRQRQIAAMYVEEAGRVRRRLPIGRGKKAATEDVFVCFDDFEQVATMEAHERVTPDELGRFEAGLGLGDAFWTTSRLSGPPIVFVHTDAQAQELRLSSAREGWADDYFSIVKRHDEFDYVQRSDIAIMVDSKAQFDEVYDSNWYYYWK